jgi:5-methylcytosine-specific restriction endonuclease McrA
MWSFKYEHGHALSIEILDFYKQDFITGVNNKKYPVPCVAKTSKYFKISHHKIKFSRKNLFIRDEYSCQYCGKQPEISKLTYDHVIPKSAWTNDNASPTNWTNIVTACIECNRKKGNRTPKQANMPLKNLPKMPEKNTRYLPIVSYLSKIREIPDEWKIYLPESYL